MLIASSAAVAKERKKTSSYRAVREVLDDVFEKGGYDLKEIDRISEEIAELGARVDRLRLLSREFSGITLSPHVATMLKLAGKDRLAEGSGA
jgi:hypothetical protein